MSPSPSHRNNHFRADCEGDLRPAHSSLDTYCNIEGEVVCGTVRLWFCDGCYHFLASDVHGDLVATFVRPVEDVPSGAISGVLDARSTRVPQ